MAIQLCETDIECQCFIFKKDDYRFEVSFWLLPEKEQDFDFIYKVMLVVSSDDAEYEIGSMLANANNEKMALFAANTIMANKEFSGFQD